MVAAAVGPARSAASVTDLVLLHHPSRDERYKSGERWIGEGGGGWRERHPCRISWVFLCNNTARVVFKAKSQQRLGYTRSLSQADLSHRAETQPAAFTVNACH